MTRVQHRQCLGIYLCYLLLMIRFIPNGAPNQNSTVGIARRSGSLRFADQNKIHEKGVSCLKPPSWAGKVSKEDYDAQLPELRAELLKAQFALLQSNIPVIIIVSGADGAGKGEVVHRLNEWLDPRGIDTHAFGALG